MCAPERSESSFRNGIKFQKHFGSTLALKRWIFPTMSQRFALLALLLQSSKIFASPCVDVHRFCPAWAKMGACKTNKDYMWRHCDKSCGCERMKPEPETTTTPAPTTPAPTTPAPTTPAPTTPAPTTVGTTSGSTSIATSEISKTSEDVETTVTDAPETSTAEITETTPSTTEVVRPLPEPTCGQYLRKANADLAGVMLARVRSPTVDACCGECDATAGCEGFSFYRGICYLKTQLQGTFLKASRTTFIRRQPTEPGQCSSFAETQENKDLAGILVKPPVFAAEQEDCCTACASVPQCEGFSYYRGFCYLKGQLQGTYPKSGCTVNVKNSARRLLGDESSQSVLV
eukprot:symbB.v1.2.024748.t1/scaffold2367.1/size81165/1